MKTILLACSILAFSLISCTIGGSPFSGHWKPIAGSRIGNEASLTLEKMNDKYYLLRLDEDPRDKIVLDYDKINDLLTGDIKLEIRAIRYLKAKDHIIIAPTDHASNTFTIEFERIK